MPVLCPNCSEYSQEEVCPICGCTIVYSMDTEEIIEEALIAVSKTKLS